MTEATEGEALVESAPGIRPIESRSVAEQVMLELRRSILCGALEPGREFSLRELAEMLQVSIIPVREALRSLENQGLVQMRPGRSAAVAPLDLGELQSVYRLRRRLEPEIAQRSCLLISGDELDRLDKQAAEFGAERYIRIGWGKLDPDPHEHRRRETHHRELVAAFRQRDPDAAASAVDQHLSRNEETALRALDGPGAVG
jgi:DNA-binding GntR family transcriptional regulator